MASMLASGVRRGNVAWGEGAPTFNQAEFSRTNDVKQSRDFGCILGFIQSPSSHTAKDRPDPRTPGPIRRALNDIRVQPE